MDGEQAPVAPASASEAPITNQTPEAAPAPAPSASAINLTSDQAEAFNKFMEANGGFDKAFAKVKSAVSNPQPQQQEVQTKVQAQAQAPQQQAKQAVSEETPKGFITQEEFAVKQYFRSLANEEEFAPIADKIRSGEAIQEMAKFGITPARDGMFNDSQIRNFLGLLAKTVPAQAPAAGITNTPTVDFYDAGETVDSLAKAEAIMMDNMSHGGVNHPKTNEAREYIKNYYANRH